MWPEFIRKLTILLIYDRLNSKGFSPKSWKPGSWFQSEILNSSTNYASQNKTGERTVFTPNMARLSTAKRNLFPDESALQVVESNNLFDVNLIMSQNMSLDNYKPHEAFYNGTIILVPSYVRFLHIRKSLNNKV